MPTQQPVVHQPTTELMPVFNPPIATSPDVFCQIIPAVNNTSPKHLPGPQLLFHSSGARLCCRQQPSVLILKMYFMPAPDREGAKIPQNGENCA